MRKPSWLDALAEECDRTSQAQVARNLRVSPAMVNQALKGTYKGDISKLKARVEGAFMGATVACPVLGAITRNVCIEHQERPFAATNPMRVQLFRACRSCQHRRRKEK